ncbi:KilA-N, DNA-binding domain protein [Bacteroides coprosuis DSM 18011]|jgi:hypothetical protein|uniref:KilA-N, DNA-binding domain protein n=1 Tax=Bacteroides coprosuis DSM 18011 TaxID=679937 RepID=F3ZU19_9BACE|nr:MULTISPECIES: ORF6N domain-containing protein [Bacteroides]EGJ71120.1 KilA-N, DNA-binding domain protein [Bacteroides coprosuis DSM 18011]NLW42292.1 ORF6N domain-containing protein [Tissierellia bacterium]HKM45423.1 ORF6N domain-containing protein [Dysgonamonadaceae bacterium]
MELQIIQNRIYEIRGMRVMLDYDLAKLYNVENRALKQAVKRNIDRFPAPDFMFELTREESDAAIELGVSQNVIPPGYNVGSSFIMAFPELGVAMLSSVLKSKKAIQVNISIMRAFVTLRQYSLGYAELNRKLDEFMIETNVQFSDIYEALTELASQKELDNKPRKRVGYVQDEEKEQ